MTEDYKHECDLIIQKNSSTTLHRLDNFLSNISFITESKNPKTNIINVGTKKSYHIPPHALPTFFEYIEACRLDGIFLHYTERQATQDNAYSGIVIDFDRYQKGATREFTTMQLRNFVQKLGTYLASLVDLSADYQFNVFVLSKPGLVFDPAKSQYKDGLHILIPELQVSKRTKQQIIQYIVKILPKVFRKLSVDCQPIADMMDSMSAHFPSHLYGNSKVGAPPYILSHVFDVVIDDEGIASVDDVKVKTLKEHNLSYELSLSFYFETFPDGRQTWLKKRQFVLDEDQESESSSEEEDEDDETLNMLVFNDPNAKHIKDMLSLLDSSYSRDYGKWFKVMCALANTHQSYKPLAIWFSKQCPEKWDPVAFETVWSDASSREPTKRPLTKRSIIHWAKECSPARFAELNKNSYFTYLSQAVYEYNGAIEHAIVGRVCHIMLGQKFVAEHISGAGSSVVIRWYEFVTPGQAMRKGEVYKWRREIRPVNIHRFMIEHLPKVYQQILVNIKERSEHAETKEETKKWAALDTAVRASMKKLSNDTYQRGVISQAALYFHHRGFVDELDKHPTILGVGNGVLELGAKPRLIDTFHEYKISKYTETDYIPYDESSPYVRHLLRAFRDIFPEEDVFEFMMLHASTGLDAKEAACMLLLLVGGGRNGKTFFAKMIHNTLGNQYCTIGKSALLTSPIEKADSANSAHIQLKGKRYCYFDEFQKCELLNVARIKAIVNPGWQTGRELYAAQEMFINTCNPIALSNYDFLIDSMDDGTWRRLLYYRNKVKFTENPDPNNLYEKPVNHKLIDECPNDPKYLEAMLSILVHYYSKLCIKYGGDIKKVPRPTIDAETKQFRNRQDSLNHFIVTMVVVSPLAEPLCVDKFVSSYMEWFNARYKKIRHSAVDIRAQLENSVISKHLIMENGNTFIRGHRLKLSADDSLDDAESHFMAPM